MTGKRLVSNIAAFSVGVLPVLVAAAIVPNCEGPTCKFKDAMQLIINIINFCLEISMPIFAIVFAWSGIKMITAAGSESQIKSAKSGMRTAFIGFIIAIGAFIIVRLLVTVLLSSDSQNIIKQFFNL